MSIYFNFYLDQRRGIPGTFEENIMLYNNITNCQ